MHAYHTDLLAILFLVGFVAGSFDAIAGGGGLITLPALLLAGLSPLEAIATNKLQTSFGSVSSSVAFAARGLVSWRSALPYATASALGSIVGALCVKLVPRPILEASIPVVLLGLAFYFLVSKRMSTVDAHSRMSPLVFGLTVAPAVGFYDGVFGPGAGSFYMVGFVAALGFGVLKATAHTKIANAGSNLGSLAVFIVTGAIVYPIGLVMGAGQLLGAQLGSHLAVKLGAKIIRPLLVVICCAMALKLLSDPTNALRVFMAHII